MAGQLKVGGNKILEHTGVEGAGVVQMLDQNGNVVLSDAGSGVSAELGSLSVDGPVVINESGADVDFRIESDTDTHALFVNSTNNKVGIFSDANISNWGTDLANQTSVVTNGAVSSISGNVVNYSGAICYQGTYIRRVMFLFPLNDWSDPGQNDFVQGRFTKHRSNGCCSQHPNILDIHIHRTYNTNSAEWTVHHASGMPLVTCNYNGITYVGINLNYGLPHTATVYFEGRFSRTDVFGNTYDYYDVRGTVINSEINDSITTIYDN